MPSLEGDVVSVIEENREKRFLNGVSGFLKPI